MIQLEGITKSFGSLQVLKGIDLEIAKGEVVSIVGPSGAGKTTLLQIMGTLDKPDSGRIVLNGTEVNRLKEKELSAFRNREIGFVFQFHQLLPEFTAVENVMMPALIQGKPMGTARKEALDILAFLGLSERGSHKPAERREERSSGWQWPGPWSIIRRLFWPMNLREVWIRRTRASCISCSSICATNWDRLLLS